MLTYSKAFSSFSVDDLEKAKGFYGELLGLEVKQTPQGLEVKATGISLFIYEKPNHIPATFTVLNFIVEDIDAAVAALTTKGVTFVHYENENGLTTDEKGIARSPKPEYGPNIAWFKDPAGNFLSVLEGE